MKRYWKLILKDRNELDYSEWKRYTCFPNLMTEIDVVNYILDQSVELKATYYKYQELLQSIKEKMIGLQIDLEKSSMIKFQMARIKAIQIIDNYIDLKVCDYKEN